ncbi:MAG: flavin reductase family protein [Erythrobacter sp.]|jgi:flavin reductase (DIM6/NTAB) family NADH-FMN oxidoreductase RutF|nr:flavin reductase family protein [Erythrobacter sp.]
MGRYATGVCVVAVPDPAADPDHGPSGMTVNSFVSISLEPMLIAWAIQNSSSQFARYTKAPAFTVSILAQDQHRLARRYAARGDSERDLADFSLSKGGLPVIAGALGHMECRRWSLYPAGDHTMIFGEVIGIERGPDASPLGFFGGEFCRIDH